jgi:hypothetical protein
MVYIRSVGYLCTLKMVLKPPLSGIKYRYSLVVLNIGQCPLGWAITIGKFAIVDFDYIVTESITRNIRTSTYSKI